MILIMRFQIRQIIAANFQGVINKVNKTYYHVSANSIEIVKCKRVPISLYEARQKNLSGNKVQHKQNLR